MVHFREFPFGTSADPTLRDFMSTEPWPNQDRVLEYLRSGHVLALPLGANLTDWFDRPHPANPVIHGQVEGGATPMGDRVWFWYAGLIYFVEKYNVRRPDEVIQYAAEQGWRVLARPAARKHAIRRRLAPLAKRGTVCSNLKVATVKTLVGI